MNNLKRFILLGIILFLPNVYALENDINQNQICLTSMQAACALQTSCRIQFMQNNAACQYMLGFYGATQALPLSLQLYQKVQVVQVLQSDASTNYFVVDAKGQIIAPSQQLSLQNVPGLLDLTGQDFSLSNEIVNFPEAVIVTENQQQLIFLQSILSNQNHQSIAQAKVLYGFDNLGEFTGAKVIRVLPATL